MSSSVVVKNQGADHRANSAASYAAARLRQALRKLKIRIPGRQLINIDNPSHRLSTATGVTNAGGFIAALIAIFLIGLALDLQGAGTPDTYSLDAFRIAFLAQVPLWLLGAAFIIVERKRTRIRIGLDPERRRT